MIGVWTTQRMEPCKALGTLWRVGSHADKGTLYRWEPFSKGNSVEKESL